MDGAWVAEARNQLEAWNRALAAELLDGRFEAQPLYLFVEPERLRALSAIIGTNLETAFTASLGWRSGVALFNPQLEDAARWERDGKRGPPPYLATLVSLTSAAAAMVADHNFSATNYRDRLCAFLGATGDRAEKVKRDLPGAGGLWQSFNDWLDDWEGALGLPTARVLGRLVNVGYPISQAIVREADRRAMHEAFVSYGLTPRRRVGTAEMVVYLTDWIARGHAPGNLTRLWGDASVRERIAQVACDELEHGLAGRPVRKGESTAPPSRLEWLAELSLEPMPRLELYLTSRADRADVEGRWKVGARTDAGGTDAVAGCREALDLRWLPQVGAVSLEPWDKIAAGSLFSGVLELVRDDRPDAHLIRSPSAVVVLSYDERDSRYHEVSRAQLLDRCLVFAHDGQADTVARHLAIHARPGFQAFRPDTLPQLPSGWVAFTDVTLVQGADDSRHPRLAALCATPATLIGLSNGLRIGQNTWHVDQAPEALAVVDPEAAPFRLLLQDRRTGTRRMLGSFIGRAAVDLGSLGLTAGEYELHIERSKNGEAIVVRRATFRLRSADHPRPTGVRRDLGLGYDLRQPWSLISASRAVDEVPNHWLRGGVWIGGELVDTPVDQQVTPLGPLGWRSGVSERAIRRSANEAGGRTHSCTVGPHHWLCEASEPGDDAKTLKWQECQLCHRFEWTRNRGAVRSTPIRKPTSTVPRPAPQMPRYARYRGAGATAYNRLLDAMSYMGSGGADTFRGLCADLDPDPWFASSALRGLGALGHVDVEADRASVRPRAWQITTPSLIGAATGEWVLTGARSEGFVAALAERLRGAGLNLVRTEVEGGPDVIAVFADEVQLAAVEFGDLITPVGAGLVLSAAFSRRVATASPRLAELASILPLFQPGGAGLERFSLSAAAWAEAELDQAGAYRLEYWGRTYGFASTGDVASQTMRLGDSALVKHLAGQAASLSLIAYDADHQSLFTPLGAELPPLLERAVVLSSGRLPRLRADLGQLQYEAVAPELAAAVNVALQGANQA